jgi:hypothetical protein
MVAAAQPKPSQAAFASDAHRREAEARAGGGAAHIAPALVLLAGVVALGVERIPALLGWAIAVIGGAWLAFSILRIKKTRY